jgi:hypothetical protein
MKLINKAGTYRGPIVEHGVGVTSNGLPQWTAALQATEVYDFETGQWNPFTEEHCDVTAFLCLFSQKQEPTFHVQNIMKAVEWDGKSLVGLNKLELVDSGVQFSVSIDEYNGKTGPKVNRVTAFDDVPQAGTIRKLSDADIKDVSAQFDALLKKAAGPAKAVSAPAASTPATPKPSVIPTKAKTVKKAAAPVAPPVEADEGDVLPPEGDEPDAAAEAVASEALPPTAPAETPGPTAKKGMSKDEAWAHCINMKAKNVTVDELTKSWRIAVKNIGKPEAKLTPQDWGTVAENVMNEHGVF